jgi:hypothetical protein
VITSMALAGIQTLSCASNRTQFQNKATLRLELKLPPSNNVTCVAKSSRRSEGFPLSSTLKFPAGGQYAETSLIGSSDGVDDGDQTFSVTVDCVSGDPRYDKASASTEAVNQDVDHPSITWLEPSVVPYIGAQITIRGQNFRAFDQISVFVGDRLVSGPPRFRNVCSCSSYLRMNGTRSHLAHKGDVLAMQISLRYCSTTPPSNFTRCGSAITGATRASGSGRCSTGQRTRRPDFRPQAQFEPASRGGSQPAAAAAAAAEEEEAEEPKAQSPGLASFLVMAMPETGRKEHLEMPRTVRIGGRNLKPCLLIRVTQVLSSLPRRRSLT